MSDSLRFSVIVPAYNRALFIARTIESVLAQERRNFELIVVDDGSTDDSVEVVRQFEGQLRLIEQSNRGPGAARNAGAAAARGEYLAFLDSDDEWFPWTLETYSQLIDAYRPAFLVGKVSRFRDEGELNAIKAAQPEAEPFADYYSAADRWRWFGASSFVVRRKDFLGVGGFSDDRINAEDVDLTMRLGVAPGFVQVTAPHTFAYRDHDSNIKNVSELTRQGLLLAVTKEKSGEYPGGVLRRRERRRTLSLHVRPHVIAELRGNSLSPALRLTALTSGWLIREGKLKFLLAVLLLSIKASITNVWRSGSRNITMCGTFC